MTDRTVTIMNGDPLFQRIHALTGMDDEEIVRKSLKVFALALEHEAAGGDILLRHQHTPTERLILNRSEKDMALLS